MKARSVVFDIFGEYVRQRGGSVSLRHLTNVLTTLSVPPDSARVVMSRLAREGWFEVTRDGRESHYRPSARALDVLSAGLDKIITPPTPGEWDGWWYIATFSVPESDRSLRARLRTQLSWYGFGQLAPAIWISPRNRLLEVEAFATAEPSVRLETFTARSCRGDDAQRAARCWDLDKLADDYQKFQDRCGEALNEQPTGAAALATRVQLAHEYRKFPFRDPGLPRTLLPAHWPAVDAHSSFLDALAALRAEAFEFYDSAAG